MEELKWPVQNQIVKREESLAEYESELIKMSS